MDRSLMTRALRLMLTLSVAWALQACGKRPEPVLADVPSPMAKSAPRAMAEQGDMAQAVSPASGEPAQAPRRYIAMRNDLLLLTESGEVEVAWNKAKQACQVADCDVLNATIDHQDQAQPAQATLEARVPQDKVAAFLNDLGKLGKIGQHSTRAEDKTDAVVDTEARLKNMTEFRDHLRQLMTTPGAKLSDLIEVERELTRVQSELDALATLRKALANETEKTLVNVTFQAQPKLLAPGTWTPVQQALSNAGHMLANSIAGLIEFLLVALPWGLVIAAVFVVIGRWRRSRRARRRDGQHA